MTRDQRIPGHKLLGQALADALIGLPYQVSTEEELALHQIANSPRSFGKFVLPPLAASLGECLPWSTTK